MNARTTLAVAIFVAPMLGACTVRQSPAPQPPQPPPAVSQADIQRIEDAANRATEAAKKAEDAAARAEVAAEKAEVIFHKTLQK